MVALPPSASGCREPRMGVVPDPCWNVDVLSWFSVSKDDHKCLAAVHLAGCPDPGRRVVAAMEIGIPPTGIGDIAGRAGF